VPPGSGYTSAKKLGPAGRLLAWSPALRAAPALLDVVDLSSDYGTRFKTKMELSVDWIIATPYGVRSPTGNRGNLQMDWRDMKADTKERPVFMAR